LIVGLESLLHLVTATPKENSFPAVAAVMPNAYTERSIVSILKT
jgi:hypothetical protein